MHEIKSTAQFGPAHRRQISKGTQVLAIQEVKWQTQKVYMSQGNIVSSLFQMTPGTILNVYLAKISSVS